MRCRVRRQKRAFKNRIAVIFLELLKAVTRNGIYHGRDQLIRF